MEEKKNNYSVYYHYNPKNGKYYIGITMREPYKRWGCNGNHYKYNTHFWNAIQREGWDNFEHVVIETGLSKEMAVSMEKRLIIECDSYNNGYNNSHGGESMVGYRMAQSTKDKIRASNSGENAYWYGKKMPREMIEKIALKHINHPNCSRKVNQYDLMGNYIATYPSINEVTRSFGVGVAKVLIGETHVFHGYQWRYADEYSENTKIEAYYKGDAIFKPVIQFSLSGEKIREYYNTRDLKEAGFANYHSHVSSVCNLSRDTYAGYIWRFLREEDVVGDKATYYDLSKIVEKINSDSTPSDKPIGQYDLQGNLIQHYPTCKKAAMSVGGVSNNISMACLGKKKTAYGYIWCYDEDVEKMQHKVEFANKKIKKCKINRYTLDGEYIDTFSGIKPAVKELGFGIPCVIDACCFGMITDAYGYIWKYAE